MLGFGILFFGVNLAGLAADEAVEVGALQSLASGVNEVALRALDLEDLGERERTGTKNADKNEREGYLGSLGGISGRYSDVGLGLGGHCECRTQVLLHDILPIEAQKLRRCEIAALLAGRQARAGSNMGRMTRGEAPPPLIVCSAAGGGA